MMPLPTPKDFSDSLVAYVNTPVARKYTRKSHVCAGRANQAKCKSPVRYEGDYCKLHRNQKVEIPIVECECYLTTGSKCSYPVKDGQFCEYHIDPVLCRGAPGQIEPCKKYIPVGCVHCKECKSNIKEDVIHPALIVKIDTIVKENKSNGRMIIPSNKKSKPVMMLYTDVTVPKELVKRNLEKPPECAICFDELVKDYRSLSCSHYFHLECISKMFKAECPVCRTTIKPACLPKWVVQRIKENKIRGEHEANRERETATREFIQNIVREDLLDMNSSEEEDLEHHIEDGREFGLTLAVDEAGRERLAVVVLGTTP